ncbi:hypothetical protein BKA04_001926 [Cryobacterium mesophilum]|nr:hypothetical protein [Terrimesophilobacter mesophilus]
MLNPLAPNLTPPELRMRFDVPFDTGIWMSRLSLVTGESHGHQ